jgi:hypothetical protein
VRIVPLVAALALLLVVAELVRRRRLREEFSWMWILAAAGALVLSVSAQSRESLGALLGTQDDTHTAVITLGLLFLAGICLDLSSKVSRLANQQKTLAQDLSRLRKQVDDCEAPAPEPD